MKITCCSPSRFFPEAFAAAVALLSRLVGPVGLLAATQSVGATPPAFDFTSNAPPVWRYQLLPGSQWTDDCLICGRPSLVLPMTGEFRLRLLSKTSLATRYSIENLTCTAGSPPGTVYRLTGKGTYEVSGEVALLQDLFLEAQADTGVAQKLCYFTNESRAVTRAWPFIEITLRETNGTGLQTFTLELAAAPIREIWFSTVNAFTPGRQPPYTNHIQGGDLVSTTGQVVRRNPELMAALGLMPMANSPDWGLDAIDLLPSGELAFSIGADGFSETLGWLHGGDVLSDRGRVLTNYAALVSPFGPEPPPADEGLDALHMLPNGEIYFSVTNDFFSEKTAKTIRKGDLLSNRGVIVRSNEQLVAPFQPAVAKQDFGLDAIYVWPDGEVWFSVETGFEGPHFEPYGPGDLLSDRGYVVARNLDLLAPFAPLEDLADFGLDALRVITDPLPPPVVREVWFSTAREFHAGIWPSTANRVSPGDFLSSSGRVVQRNHDLMARLGLMPGTGDFGLDAVDVRPGGEVVFSIEQDVWSETLGALHHGDLLSNRGRIVARNADLVRAFQLMPPVPDLGLDAVQVLASGEILFSIETETFSGTAGQLRRGDLLSSTGGVVRTQEGLLARFHPPLTRHDWGLDAIYVWPTGEIWFSLEEGFVDGMLGAIQPGDLLSDSGYVVARQASLVGPFAPLETSADFGLDAIFVVSDDAWPVAASPTPECTVAQWDRATGDVVVTWTGGGRAFQIEKASDPAGPWMPLSPILIEPPVVDAGAANRGTQGFYRLRQW